MDFGEALRALKDGRKIKREGWPVADPLAHLYVYLEEREGHSTEAMVLRADGCRSVFPLLGFHLLAEDWQLAEED